MVHIYSNDNGLCGQTLAPFVVGLKENTICLATATSASHLFIIHLHTELAVMTNLDFLFNIIVNNSDFIPGTGKLF